jgi:hypothetical protein
MRPGACFSLVTRESPYEPLVNDFLRIALTLPQDTPAG